MSKRVFMGPEGWSNSLIWVWGVGVIKTCLYGSGGVKLIDMGMGWWRSSKLVFLKKSVLLHNGLQGCPCHCHLVLLNRGSWI